MDSEPEGVKNAPFRNKSPDETQFQLCQFLVVMPSSSMCLVTCQVQEPSDLNISKKTDTFMCGWPSWVAPNKFLGIVTLNHVQDNFSGKF